MKLEHGEEYRTSLIATISYDAKGKPIRRSIPTIITKKGGRLWLQTGFCKPLTEELKTCLSGMKWHGYDATPIKQWSCYDDHHNWFQIEYFEGKNPYKLYDAPLVEIPHEVVTEGPQAGMLRLQPSGRVVYTHQYELIQHFLTRRHAFIAGEMGVGKSLAALEAMERSGATDWLVVAPASALVSLKLEFAKWKSFLKPTFCTYSSLEKYINEWPSGKTVHQGLLLDESAWVKTPTAKRTLASQHIANSIRDEWGLQGFIIEMSGAPAPKSPLDWYSQCEIARPGFLKERDLNKFKDRLAIVIQRENQITGGVYPELKAWRDNEKKCNVCGELTDHVNHNSDCNMDFHHFKPCVNEVSKLYTRMKGLVMIKTKSECLQLPDKIYRIVTLEPTKDMVRAARLLVKKSPSTIQALTLLRELSDGFQYTETVKGTQVCQMCHGKRTTKQLAYIGPDKTFEFIEELGLLGGRSPTEEELFDWVIPPQDFPQYYEEQELSCTLCDGTGEEKLYERTTHMLPCPKEDFLADLIEEHDDVGRLVVFAGFTGSVDRCISVAERMKWDWIRVDGRGFHASWGATREEMIQAFQEKLEEFPRIVFIGNPQAAGTGLTLTKSPTILYYSNTFNGNDRIQSEDRIHRIGMDANRGATIIDLFHLPTDKLVYDNIRKKRELQDISLGQLTESFVEERNV